MAKQFYFDELVWNNIMGFVDIKPFKKDVFVNGTYSRSVPFYTQIESFKIIGRTKCFIKCIHNGAETKKKIFIEDGLECIKIGKLKVTAHDNEQYKFATKKEWKCYRNPYGIPSDDESDESDEEQWLVEYNLRFPQYNHN